jgi:hypothetical protein
VVFVLFYVYVWARWLSRMVWCGGQNDFKIFISLVCQARPGGTYPLKISSRRNKTSSGKANQCKEKWRTKTTKRNMTEQ